VVYGVFGYKIHAKMALVIRRDNGALQRYAHLGTGNYHQGTSRIYTDFGLLTADEQPAGEPEILRLPRRIDDPDGIALLAPGKMLICEASVVANQGKISLLEIDGDRVSLTPVIENADLAVPTGVAVRDGKIYVAESQVAALFIPERAKDGLKPFAVRRFELPANLAALAAKP